MENKEDKMLRIMDSLGKLLARVFIVVVFYGIYKIVGFELTVVISLAGIFVNTNPDR